MFIFGFIVGGAVVAGVWFAWERYGKAAAKAADAFSSGLTPKE